MRRLTGATTAERSMVMTVGATTAISSLGAVAVGVVKGFFPVLYDVLGSGSVRGLAAACVSRVPSRLSDEPAGEQQRDGGADERHQHAHSGEDHDERNQAWPAGRGSSGVRRAAAQRPAARSGNRVPVPAADGHGRRGGGQGAQRRQRPQAPAARPPPAGRNRRRSGQNGQRVEEKDDAGQPEDAAHAVCVPGTGRGRQ